MSRHVSTFAFWPILRYAYLMSRSAVVDHRYRLQPADLAHLPPRLRISGVSLQGVEQIHPVLHFADAPHKPLVLDARQCQTMMQLTQSAVCTDWVGHTIQLQMASADLPPAIQIVAPTAQAPKLMPRQRQAAGPAQLWRTLLPILVLGLALLSVWLLDRVPGLWERLLDLLR